MIKLIQVTLEARYCLKQSGGDFCIAEAKGYRYVTSELTKSASYDVRELVPRALDVHSFMDIFYNVQWLIEDHFYHRGIKYD